MLKVFMQILFMGCFFAAFAFIGMVVSQPNLRVQRYGSVIGVKPEKIQEYNRLHAAVWPGVLNKIKDCNIRNYSIYIKEIEPGKYYLFSYFEYVGNDFDADMKKMADDPLTQQWWDVTKPCQIPLETRAEGEHWATMKEVFHLD